MIGDDILERQRVLMQRFNLPITAQGVDLDAVRGAMSLDKKTVGGANRWCCWRTSAAPLSGGTFPARWWRKRWPGLPNDGPKPVIREVRAYEVSLSLREFRSSVISDSGTRLMDVQSPIPCRVMKSTFRDIRAKAKQ